MNELNPSDLLELYLQGELDEPQVRRVEQWLESNEDAKQQLEAARLLLARLDDSLTSPQNADDFVQRTLAAAEQQAHNSSHAPDSPFGGPANRTSKPTWLLVSTLGVLAAAAAIALVVWLLPSVEPPFEGPMPAALAEGFAPKKWFVRATKEAEFESPQANQLQLNQGEVEVSTLKPCEVVTPFAHITGANVRFLVACGQQAQAASESTHQAAHQAARILVLSGSLTVKNSHGEVKANKGDLIVAAQDSAPTRLAVTANNGFAIDLYRELARSGEPGANLLVSPYSAHSVLAMAAAGARGKTAEEMEKMLHFPDAARRWSDQMDRSSWQASLFHSGAAKLMERIQRANDPAHKKIRDHLQRLRAQLDRQNRTTSRLEYGDGAEASYQKARATAKQINRLQEQIDHFELNVANSAWLDRSVPIQQDFLALLRDGYRIGEARNVDFRRAPAQQAKTINDWVSAQTRGRIEDLIDPRALSSNTRMVLVNAIYFRGDWEEPFRERRTKTKPFQMADGGLQQVPLMRGYKSAARYGAVQGDGSLFASPDTVEDGKQDDPQNYPGPDGFLMAEMAYDNSGISMLLLVPQDPKGLPALESALSDKALAGWIKGLKKRDMRVEMPRFRLDASHALKEPLQRLGMTTAFRSGNGPDRADFSGIADSAEGLFIGKVVQKAFIEVNEKGTVAAAATGLAVDGEAMAPRSVPFIPTVRADRPFLFLLRDQDTGAILFMGRVMKPLQ